MWKYQGGGGRPKWSLLKISVTSVPLLGLVGGGVGGNLCKFTMAHEIPAKTCPWRYEGDSLHYKGMARDPSIR